MIINFCFQEAECVSLKGARVPLNSNHVSTLPPFVCPSSSIHHSVDFQINTIYKAASSANPKQRVINSLIRIGKGFMFDKVEGKGFKVTPLIVATD